MLIPIDADNPKHDFPETKQEISQTLSLNQQDIQQQEQLHRQAQIQKLIPQIKEPIIL
jgi:ABC-type iron transport system FetAB permease component